MLKVTSSTLDGKPIDMEQYKKDLHTKQNEFCPVTMEKFDIDDGVVLYNRFGNKDVFISKIGLYHLRHIYGEDYINKLIVDSIIADDENAAG